MYQTRTARHVERTDSARTAAPAKAGRIGSPTWSRASSAKQQPALGSAPRTATHSISRIDVVQRAVHPDYALGLTFAQRVLAMFALVGASAQAAELKKLQGLADPLKDSKAKELGKLATVIAAGNAKILDAPRSSQVQTEANAVLAMAYEARDTGHSLDRHGPDVTDTKLQDRLKTGVAPDGSFSPTPGLSTRFSTHEEYVKTRVKAATDMSTAITATRDDLKTELKTLATAQAAFDRSPPGPHKAAGQPLRNAIANAAAAVQGKVNATGNPHATRLEVRFVPNAADPAGYITMFQSYSIVVDHGRTIGMGFRGKPASLVQIAHPTTGAMVDAWTAWDKEDALTRTRTGMDTGANHQQLFGTVFNPAAWTAFQHFPVDEPVGVQH